MSNPYDKSTAHGFLKKIRQTIEAHSMLRKGDSVLVGVSGGPDSMALLHALVAVSGVYRLRLGIAHLNHGLRQGDSDKDAEFVVTAAKKLDLPAYIEKKDIASECRKTGGSIEEAGRMARYRFFSKTAETEGFDRIAVGHHRDDNAELILLYLLRGSGPAGLSGIPPVRGKIIRPLIGTSGAEIADFLDMNKIDYVIDQSNTDRRFLRNRIRHQLLPLLEKEYNPKAAEALNRLGMILRSDENWIEAHIRSILDRLILDAEKEKIALSLNELLYFHPALKKRVIRQAIRRVKGDLRRISYAHINAVIKLMENNSLGSRIDLPDRIRVYKQADRVLISREKESLRSPALSGKTSDIPEFAYTVSKSDIPGRDGAAANPLYIKKIDIYMRFYRINRSLADDLRRTESRAAYMDWDCLRFPLVIRNYRAGDRFTPLGMTGSQKLKNFFINNKISRSDRALTPIVSDSEGIIWVGGYRISERVKVTDATTTVLKAEISRK